MKFIHFIYHTLNIEVVRQCFFFFLTHPSPPPVVTFLLRSFEPVNHRHLFSFYPEEKGTLPKRRLLFYSEFWKVKGHETKITWFFRSLIIKSYCVLFPPRTQPFNFERPKTFLYWVHFSCLTIRLNIKSENTQINRPQMVTFRLVETQTTRSGKVYDVPTSRLQAVTI